MAQQSPLHELHKQAEASFLQYGALEGAQVVETFGELEAEYAGIRKGCILLDCPHRGFVRVTGEERIDFLQRMVTAELKDLRAFQARRSFWLNRKGRIDADLRIIQLPEEMYFDLDLLVSEKAVQTLSDFVFAEDVEFTDVTNRHHRLSLHGPKSLDLLQAVATHDDGAPLDDLQPGQACRVTIAGHPVLVDRQDALGEVGLELGMSVEHVSEVYQQLMEMGLNGDPDRYRLRTAGWHAYNIARIESGWPLFNVDFGSTSLPHESGVLHDRVNFKKGCYLGQEVVARMESLGRPKQMLVGVRVQDIEGAGLDQSQPVTGAGIFAMDDADESAERKPIGAVTSSTRSPMLGDQSICFAMLKYDQTTPGTKLRIQTSAGDATGIVNDSLRFWSSGS